MSDVRKDLEDFDRRRTVNSFGMVEHKAAVAQRGS